MTPFVKKFFEVQSAIARKKGAFELFALVRRDDTLGKWDLLVAAPWIEKDKSGAVRYISRHLQNRLTPDELIELSRVVPLDRTHPALTEFQRDIHIDNEPLEIKHSNLFGLDIVHAYVFTAQKIINPGVARKRSG